MRRRQVAQGVTTARRSAKEDREHRMRTYLIAMLIRTISFPLAVWALLSGWLVVGLIFAAAAIFLPQIAVTIANAVDRRTVPDAAPVSPIRALPEGGPPRPHPTAHPDGHHHRPDGAPSTDGRDDGL
ncbi:DUF3099 domain-containing protein [Ornithinimicrobium cryptoxanthini]|uniref:DUF3099 domain-containing protein n=1 Tax=Ornithinimicrobium cryptoxanthini TaxID=2934161 RepID=A0ABY4YDP1_9MICO|nr:DUF3099 domain-containing protein [Ornithinimicrobium cryptoxanthini]USQ74896.1 DUF3099 domain-containing protein [Ornithinimicrobium cryptoxanthini]